MSKDPEQKVVLRLDGWSLFLDDLSSPYILAAVPHGRCYSASRMVAVPPGRPIG